MFQNSIHIHQHRHFLIMMIGHEANIIRSFFILSFFTAIPIVLDSAIGSSAWGQELAYKFSMFNCFCGRLQMFQNSIHIHQHGHFLIMIGHEANIIRSFFILSFFTAIPSSWTALLLVVRGKEAV